MTSIGDSLQTYHTTANIPHYTLFEKPSWSCFQSNCLTHHRIVRSFLFVWDLKPIYQAQVNYQTNPPLFLPSTGKWPTSLKKVVKKEKPRIICDQQQQHALVSVIPRLVNKYRLASDWPTSIKDTLIFLKGWKMIGDASLNYFEIFL